MTGKNKMNNFGFTLIELLAVITIMGILMFVAVPAIARTIENTRKDTLVDTAKKYVNSARTLWSSDSLECMTSSSGNYMVSTALPDGTYYIQIDTTSTSYPVLLERGGKSSWGNRDIKGIIKINISTVGANPSLGTTGTRKITYNIKMADGIHGIKATTSYEDLKRSDVTMTGQTHTTTDYVLPTGGFTCREI